MLTITVPGAEFWNAEKEMFEIQNPVVLKLEHSLVSLSKWESIWEKPFLTEGGHTAEELLSYIEQMLLPPNTSPEILQRLTEENVEVIHAYIEKKSTATWFSDDGVKKPNKEIITSELIYYWMVACQISWEAQHWHLNRLITLIRIYEAKNSKPKKMSRGEAAEQRRRLNEQRKKQYNTRG